MKVLCRAIFATALFLAPESRKEWIEAMAAEIAQVPRGEKVQFALGAVRFSFNGMMEEAMLSKTNTGIFVIMMASAFLAFVGISNGFRIFEQDPTAGVAFALMGGLWLAAFVAAMLRHWGMLNNLASGGVAMSGALGLAWLISVPALEANRELFGALALEALFLFAVLLAAGLTVRKLAISNP